MGLLLLLVLGVLCLTSNAYIVKLAVVHRHGDRTPSQPWKDAPVSNASDWPEGWYQMTLGGHKRLYNLGHFLRKRYPTIITEDPTEVMVKSSPRKRCLTSTQSLLAGVFPPTKLYEIHPALNWQPIPVLLDGWMLTNMKCPAADIERDKLRLTDPEASFDITNKHIYDYLTTVSGRNVTNNNEASSVRSRIKVAMDAGKRIPSWATGELMDRLEKISVKSFYFMGRSIAIQRLKTGIFFKDLISQLSNPWSKKLLVYSTHDTQMAIMMNAMDSYPNQLIGFGSSLLFELHANVSTTRREYPVRDTTLKIYLLNDTRSKKLLQVVPSGCQSQECKFSNFAVAMKPILADDVRKECQLVIH